MSADSSSPPRLPEQQSADPLVEKPATDQPSPTSADGGVVGWLQVAGSFFLFFNSWGSVNAFGYFQTYYEQDLLRTQSASNIAWIGSIQSFLLLFVGMLSGPLFDRGYFRGPMYLGTLLLVLGTMMTSLGHEYYQLVLAQSLVVGIGGGLLFVPSVAVLPGYFTARRSLAQGIAASGSSIGAICFTEILTHLVPRIGFGWTVRIIGFIQLATMLFSVGVLRPKPRPVTTQKRALVDLGAFRDVPFMLFNAACLLGFAGIYIPFFYSQTFALANLPTLSTAVDYSLVPILNAGSFFGRIGLNAAADKIGCVNVLLLSSVATALLGYVWAAVHENASGPAGFVVWCTLYGFASGGFVSLLAPIAVALVPSMDKFGTWLGVNLGFCAVGLLIGTPIAGAVLGSSGGWLALQMFCGSIAAGSCLLITASRVSKAGMRLRARI